MIRDYTDEEKKMIKQFLKKHKVKVIETVDYQPYYSGLKIKIQGDS